MVGANEKSSILMLVPPPPHASDHGHKFWTLLVDTYRIASLCCLVVLTFTIFYVSMVVASQSNDKTFDKDLLFFIPPISICSIQH